MISAANADGGSGSIGGPSAGDAADRVCRKGKAQGYGLREGRRRDATGRLRVGEMALASHYGINL
jgi:hypothetical protein